ncbi:adenylate/guanylate cyclase domain-containing protein [Nocardioides sp.]|uniref:adenylate/guanylate cyclase domain-containing protein n=1 Tax=Nocardioides sp. TaxID=35761 RepID=UPI00261AB355|nr:adenylate/guanylate cyclase domain-containing protein [Nocardioides sp.]
MPDSEAPRFTSAEVASITGISEDRSKRLWRALGFADAGGEAIYSEADIEALRTVEKVLETGVVDFDMAINLTRGLGLSMARLAEWEVSALAHQFDGHGEEDGTATAPRAAAETFSTSFNPSFERLMIYAWRRHMANAMGRLDTADEANTIQVTVGFADIVSFTALSNTLSEEKIGDLVELFESRCADVVALQKGRVIKSLGDSVLFINEDPIRALDTGEGIINVIGRDPRMPDVRVGIATGSVVLRMGDVFGPPVNMAARLTAVARRNRIIIDEATAGQLPPDLFETRRLPARPVRGFGVLEPVAVMRH